MKAFKDFEPGQFITFLYWLKQERPYPVEINPFELLVLEHGHVEKFHETYNTLIGEFKGWLKLPHKKRNPVNALLKAYTNPNIYKEVLCYGFSKERKAYFKKIWVENSITRTEQLSGPYKKTGNGKEFSIEEYKPRMIPAAIYNVEITWLIDEYRSLANNQEFGQDKRTYFTQRLKYFEEMFRLGMEEKRTKELNAEKMYDAETDAVLDKSEIVAKVAETLIENNN